MITQDLVTSSLHSTTDQGSLLIVGKRILRNKSFVLGGLVVLGFLLLALVPQLFTAYDPIGKDLAMRLQPPSGAHWFGTDDLGRDICARIVYGARISLKIGLISVGSPMCSAAAPLRARCLFLRLWHALTLAIWGRQPPCKS